MSYDSELAARVRDILADETDVVERRMFGGLAFLVGGHLAVSASSRGGLLLRVDPAPRQGSGDGPGVRPFVMNGRELAGWLQVDLDAVASDEELRRRVDAGVAYARSLPPK